MRAIVLTVAALLLVACASAPAPTSGVTDAREVTLRGVRLGMTRADVEDALLAEGFTVSPGLGHSHSWERLVDTSTGDAQETMLVGYAQSGDQELLSIVRYTQYWRRSFFDARFGSEGARRQEIQRLIGANPQVWRRPPSAYFVGNGFAFAANRRQARRLSSARHEACFWAWDCVSVRDGVDCRPVVDRRQGAVVKGEFVSSGQLTIEMYDYDVFAADLMRNTAFRTRNLEGLGCMVFYVD